MTPFWFYDPIDSITTKLVDFEIANRQYPIKKLLQLGVVVGFGSDWPVSTPNPLEGINVAISRSYEGEKPSLSED